MPKLIDNLEALILAEARRQISTNGYSATTMRSVAAGCGIAVGTLYNYYPSKEMMTATYMLQDWQQLFAKLSAQLSGTAAPKDALRLVYEGLQAYIASYGSLFRDAGAIQASAEHLPLRHNQLKSQIAQLLLPFCGCKDSSRSILLAEFTAENLLSFDSAKYTFDDLWYLLRNHFGDKEI